MAPKQQTPPVAGRPAIIIKNRLRRSMSSTKADKDHLRKNIASTTADENSNEGSSSEKEAEQDSDSDYQNQNGSDSEDCYEIPRPPPTKKRSPESATTSSPLEKDQINQKRVINPKQLTISKAKNMKIKPDLTKDVYWPMIFDQWDQVQKLRGNLKLERQKLKSLRSGQIERLKEIVENQKGRIEKKTSKVDDLKRQLENLELQVKRANERNINNEVRIADMHEENQRLLAKKETQVTPDDKVRETLHLLFEETKSWSKEWAKLNWNETSDTMMRLVADTGRNDDIADLASITARKAIERKKLAPRILVNALVNRILCSYTFVHIFSFTDTSKKRNYPLQIRDTLEWIVKLKREHDKTAAHHLRASLMQALSKSTSSAVEKLSPQNAQDVSNAFKSHVQYVLDRVMDEAQHIFKDLEDDAVQQRDDALRSLIRSYLSASIELNSQFPCIQVTFRHGLEGYGFETEHELFQPHRVLKLSTNHGDGDSTAQEAGVAGKKIDLVVQPLVERLGDADGAHYEVKRVLVKAVVWMALLDKSKNIEAQSSNASKWQSREAHELQDLPAEKGTKRNAPRDDDPPKKKKRQHENDLSKPPVTSGAGRNAGRSHDEIECEDSYTVKTPPVNQ